MMPPELITALANTGLQEKDVPSCQLILVTKDVSGTTARCYEKAGIWRFVASIGIVGCHVGRNGIALEKTEGDGCTPSGFYRLGHAFGCKPKPDTKMPYRTVTANSYWVDDPESVHYNTWVESSVNRDWSSAEHLWAYQESYAYAVVIEYNTVNPLPLKGSAVFLHCGTKPTAGCIAVSEADILALLRWLDPAKTPGILITKTE